MRTRVDILPQVKDLVLHATHSRSREDVALKWKTGRNNIKDCIRFNEIFHCGRSV